VGNYPRKPYTMGLVAKAGDTIHVWMYSPATPGSVVIDDASLMLYLRNPGFEESTVPALGPAGCLTVSGRRTPNPRPQRRTAATRTARAERRHRSTADLPGHRAPLTGDYLFTVYASADHPGALVGADINGTFVGLNTWTSEVWAITGRTA